MDDLIALFDDPELAGDVLANAVDPSTTELALKTRPPKKSKAVKTQPPPRAQIAVDERVGGIQMINRLISSSQLEDYVDEYDFHTAAQLGFYSHEMLNTKVLLDSVDMSTTPLAGNTRIFTVGIVMQHSGSRLTASNGQAFAKVDIGTLRTGPTLSVLLFGTAYRVHTQSVTAGTVIGLLQPRLLPPKPGDRLALAVNDANQVIVIAKARDFGRCQGQCRGKNEKGIWVADARPCRNIVDTSISRYCKEHQKKSNQKKNAFQELRDQAPLHHPPQQHRKENGRIMTLPKNMGAIKGVAATNSLLHATARTAKASLTKPANRFDGSVMVPQAAALFGRCHVPVQSNLHSGPRDRKPDEIRATQRKLAQQQALITKKTPPVLKQTTKKRIVTPQNAFAAAFGPTLDMEEEKLRNAQSSFANEANAEEYARSCQVLTELEKLEAKKRPKEKDTKRMIQIWHCGTCQSEFRKEPKGCFRRNHKIKLERTLRKDETLSDKRQKRTNADALNGGLVLGQGLDWSVGNRFDR